MLFIINLIIILVDPDSRVIRECGSNSSEVKTLCYTRYGVSATQSICECDISYCNGAEYVKQSTYGFICAVAFIVASRIINTF